MGTFVGMGCFLFNTTASMTLEKANQYCQGVENASLIEIHTQVQLDFFKMERDVIEHEGGRKQWGQGGTMVLDDFSRAGAGLCLVANSAQWWIAGKLHVRHCRCRSEFLGHQL